MVRSGIILFLSFTSFISSSQDFWKSGYIVLSTGDTLRGLVRDEQWVKNPTKVLFKNQANSEEVVYDNNQVVSFYTGVRNIYVSHRFKFDGDLLGQKLSYMGPTPGYPRTRMPVKWIESSCFLEQVLGGTYALYKYTDDDYREHFFILTPELTNPEELQYHVYLPYEKSNVQSTSEYFKYQFQQLTKECSTLNNRIIEMHYTESELVKMVRLINECKGGVTLNISHNKTKGKLLVGLLIQGYLNKFSDLTGSNFTGPYPGVGISVESFSKRRPDRLSFYNELKFNFLNSNNTHFSSQYANVTVRFTSVKLVSMFRQYLVSSNMYLNIGLINGYLLKIQMEKNPNFPDNFFETGLVTGAGINFSKIKATAELRFELNSPIQATSDNSFGITNSLGLIISKRFEVMK